MEYTDVKKLMIVFHNPWGKFALLPSFARDVLSFASRIVSSIGIPIRCASLRKKRSITKLFQQYPLRLMVPTRS